MPTRRAMDARGASERAFGSCRRCRRRASNQTAATQTRSPSVGETRACPCRTIRLRVRPTNAVRARRYRCRQERDGVQGSETGCPGGRSNGAFGALRSRTQWLQEECPRHRLHPPVVSRLLMSEALACRAPRLATNIPPSRTGGIGASRLAIPGGKNLQFWRGGAGWNRRGEHLLTHTRESAFYR
jgi:hypothetical protein